jgi:uncharacterized phage-associated protein
VVLNKKMISALDVAWYFVVKGNGDPSITQLKLQKLCYYAQGFYLGCFSKQLFVERIEAWEKGPVVFELRRQLASKGKAPISKNEEPFGNPILSKLDREHLEKIWARFGGYSAGELVEMTHKESPWVDAFNGDIKYIEEKAMLTYFQSRAEDIEAIDQPFTDLANKTTDKSYSEIFLKSGAIAQVHVDDLDQFLVDNWDNLTTKKGERFGPARDAQGSYC